MASEEIDGCGVSKQKKHEDGGGESEDEFGSQVATQKIDGSDDEDEMSYSQEEDNDGQVSPP